MTYISVALREEVTKRAKSCCEYCLLPEKYSYFSHEIDHIYAEKHGGETVSFNLCVACAVCNRHKSSDICSIDPETKDIVTLFHPRQHLWTDHFELLETGLIKPISAHGRVTARLLAFNLPDLTYERRRLLQLGAYKDES